MIEDKVIMPTEQLIYRRRRYCTGVIKTNSPAKKVPKRLSISFPGAYVHMP
jgi:hypothetical protein